MLVYGDAALWTTAGDKLCRVRERLAGLHNTSRGIQAHATLVGAFIEAAELAQGLADAEFVENDSDADTPLQQAAMAVLTRFAETIRASWQSGFAAEAKAPPLCAALSMLANSVAQDRDIQCKAGEGYLHYALYPESYLAAASALNSDTQVIGIRSIGLGLAALAAVGAAGRPPVSLRPIGHPFRREVAVSESLGASFSAHAGDFAIVDEGPGLSGSSFGAVADFLEHRRINRSRIHFLPSHAGDLGPEATPRHRVRWRSAPRHTVDFDTLVLNAPRPQHRLPSWVEDLTGRATRIEDISGGAWRRQSFTGRAWPPAYTHQERRKFLLEGESGAYLLKFAGLGCYGEAKCARGCALHDAGFTPQIFGWRHGFLVERWLREGLSGPVDIDRAALLRRLGDYVGFRAKHFAAMRAGASLPELARMAQVNAAKSLGPEFAHCADRWLQRLPELQRISRPVEIDGRLHAWEWLRLSDGRLIKTDALDHHAAHDLIGCQDIAWDIAGAAVEFDLSEVECQELRGRVERASGTRVNVSLLEFLLPCYLAFQIGLWSMAAAASDDLPETERLRRIAASYMAKLRDSVART